MRIQVVEHAFGPLVRVEGKLSEESLALLHQVCSRQRPPLRLDLGELRSADNAAVLALIGLRDSGAELVNVPPYLLLLLEDPR